MCRDADKVSRRIGDVLKDVATLEILQAPGLTFKIPELFASIPRLTGATSMLATDPLTILSAVQSTYLSSQLFGVLCTLADSHTRAAVHSCAIAAMAQHVYSPTGIKAMFF